MRRRTSRAAGFAVPRHPLPIDFWRAMALRGFEGALSTAGLTLADTVPVDVPADAHAAQWSAELAALRAGTVDAVYAKGATAVEAAARYGARIAVELDDHPDRRTRVNNGTPARSPSARACWTSGRTWSPATSPSSSGPPTGRLLPPGRPRPGTEPGDRRGRHRRRRCLPGPRHRDLRIDLSDERLDLLARQEHALRGHGFLAAPVDVRDWAAPEPLRGATDRVRRPATTEDHPWLTS